jgi:hypothetical protein
VNGGEHTVSHSEWTANQSQRSLRLPQGNTRSRACTPRLPPPQRPLTVTGTLLVVEIRDRRRLDVRGGVRVCGAGASAFDADPDHYRTPSPRD